MPTVEERVAYIEGQMSEQSHGLMELRDAIRGVHLRIDALDQRMESRFDAVDRRFETMDDRMSRQFVWLVGIQVTTLVAIVGALLTRA